MAAPPRRRRRLYLGEKRIQKIIRNVRPLNKGILIAFEGTETPEAAREFTNQFAFVRSDELPELPDGEYYHHELLGSEIIDMEGMRLGVLAEILETGANDVYIVKKDDGSELLLPNTDEVILKVDLQAGHIQVKPPEWI